MAELDNNDYIECKAENWLDTTSLHHLIRVIKVFISHAGSRTILGCCC